MDLIINNWAIIMAIVAVIVVAAVCAYRYFKLPTDKQLQAVREWLLWAVTEAERELGSGTGALKLRQVYDLFVLRFPWLVRVITFEVFSSMVDDALEEMRYLLSTNQSIKAMVEGGHE